MVPLPAALAPDAPLVAWRLDLARWAATWDSGLGAELGGGRWNPKGVKAVYCSLDPSTCIIEKAVHVGFKVLDNQAHVLTSFEIPEARDVRVVTPDEVPNPGWLENGQPSANQQAWGAALLAAHGFVAFPSTVSKRSWNLVFQPAAAAGRYRRRAQERMVIDSRLNPAA